MTMRDGHYRTEDGTLVHVRATRTGWLITYPDGTTTEVARVQAR